jgi:hypothetical protein
MTQRVPKLLEYKVCSKCKTTKDVDLFYKSKSGALGRSGQCKDCTNKRHKNAYCPQKALAKALKGKYNITIADYDQLLFKQENCCAICRGSDTGHLGRFVVDHDHLTGKVRGLLCWSCNVGIGHLKDNPQILVAAANYLNVNGHYG